MNFLVPLYMQYPENLLESQLFQDIHDRKEDIFFSIKFELNNFA